MKSFESKKVRIKRSSKEVFNFLSDFNNFESLMPEQIINWKSTKDTCSFTIQGMTDLAMKIEERVPNTNIFIVPDGKAPFKFELICNLEEIENSTTDAQIILKANLNPMLSMVASKPLSNLVNIMVEKMKEVLEGSSEK